MHSPLPDSSALEAGILEDEQPSRLSRVQDNVRNLLRNSRFSSTQNSPPSSSPPHNNHHGLPTPPQSPTHHRPRGMPPSEQPEVIASPAESNATTSSSSIEPTTPDALAEVHFPPSSYRRTVQQMAHQSALFNTRAVAALNHPDLSDPSLAVLIQNKSQRRAWKRSRKGSSSKRARAEGVFGSSQCFLCVLAALLLSAIVATYLVLATTSSNITPTFHILFILGILLATIVFAHTVVRLFLFSGNSRRVFIVRSAKHRRHRRDRHNRPPRIMAPVVSNDATAFVPPTPIPVHMPADEVRPDSREAHPTATPSIAPLSTSNEWDKDADPVPNPPPPAYGRWRGSVRANPDLLHWQVLPSPVDPDAHELPSPTYEATQGAQTAPPSYVTRESPARQRAEAVREIPIEEEAARESQEAQFVSAEPEMVEGAGIGLGV